MVAQEVKFHGCIYTYSHSKHNVMIYISQPAHYYEDWTEDGGILVVEYRPDKNEKEQYYVLHELRVNEGSGYINHTDLTVERGYGCNRFAIPVEKK